MYCAQAVRNQDTWWLHSLYSHRSARFRHAWSVVSFRSLWRTHQTTSQHPDKALQLPGVRLAFHQDMPQVLLPASSDTPSAEARTHSVAIPVGVVAVVTVETTPLPPQPTSASTSAVSTSARSGNPPRLLLRRGEAGGGRPPPGRAAGVVAVAPNRNRPRATLCNGGAGREGDQHVAPEHPELHFRRGHLLALQGQHEVEVRAQRCARLARGLVLLWLERPGRVCVVHQVAACARTRRRRERISPPLPRARAHAHTQTHTSSSPRLFTSKPQACPAPARRKLASPRRKLASLAKLRACYERVTSGAPVPGKGEMSPAVAAGQCKTHAGAPPPARGARAAAGVRRITRPPG